MGPVAPNAEVAARAPNLPPKELLRPFDNHSGIVATRCARPDRVRHATEYRPDVAWVHSGTADLHHGITGGQVARQIDLDQLQRGVKRLGAVNLCRDADSGAAPGGEAGVARCMPVCAFECGLGSYVCYLIGGIGRLASPGSMTKV